MPRDAETKPSRELNLYLAEPERRRPGIDAPAAMVRSAARSKIPMIASRTTSLDVFHEFLATNLPEHGLGGGTRVLFLGGVGGPEMSSVFFVVKRSEFRHPNSRRDCARRCLEAMIHSHFRHIPSCCRWGPGIIVPRRPADRSSRKTNPPGSASACRSANQFRGHESAESIFL
jgi:hypothetical protein